MNKKKTQVINKLTQKVVHIRVGLFKSLHTFCVFTKVKDEYIKIKKNI